MFSKHFKKIYKKDKEYIAPTRCLPRLSMNVLVLTKKKKKKGVYRPLIIINMNILVLIIYINKKIPKPGEREFPPNSK
jgi:hypothetical protein